MARGPLTARREVDADLLGEFLVGKRAIDANEMYRRRHLKVVVVA
jgi:hypothetical protein